MIKAIHERNLKEKTEGFATTIESIMQFEDFKSNFARRLSNRYVSRSPIKQDTALKLCLADDTEVEKNNNQLEKPNNIVIEETTEKVIKHEASADARTDLKSTKLTVLNMEVETLRWQLAQTESNRQIHIALLKQIVTFLTKVKEHMNTQIENSDLGKAVTAERKAVDLPRSHSVLHFNKNPELSNSSKKLNTKKISKSISNVSRFNDINNTWTQTQLALLKERDSSEKLTEEISRLITLANAVLTTKIPDLACACNEYNNESFGEDVLSKLENKHLLESNRGYDSLNENDGDSDIINTFDGKLNQNQCDVTITTDFNLPSKTNVNVIEDDFLITQLNTEISVNDNDENKICFNEREHFFNNLSNYIEDESGFSSMSSFQEIGIPVINIIPPSPSKDSGYGEENSDVICDTNKWKTDNIAFDKQGVKVFWV